MLPPAGLEVQIFVNPKETQNVPAEPAGLSDQPIATNLFQSQTGSIKGALPIVVHATPRYWKP